VPLPIQLPMLAFAVFGGVVQALVFTMLAASYIGGAVAHEEGH
jgi:F0F1-type ATP synthase membrane subunit a